jgi:putative ABC transport system ATP-binding protein
MLELRGVIKIFNKGTQDEKTALNGIDLRVGEGEFITIIGSNGAGKSTLLNAIAGTCTPDLGQILVDGDDVTQAPDYRMARHLARVFQDPAAGTAASMSIEENLCMAELRGQRRGLRWGVNSSRRDRYRQVLKVLDLGLEDRLRDKVGLLSGGQRQSLVHEHRLTTLMVTHNMNQAIQHGSRMIMLHEGRTQLDLQGEDKQNLTVAEVVAKFGQTLKDETLLSAG